LLQFHVSSSYVIPAALAQATLAEFESVLTFSAKLLDLKENLTSQYAKDTFFENEIKKLTCEADTEKQQLESRLKKEYEKELGIITRAEADTKRTYDREIASLQKRLAEVQVELAAASKAESTIREQERTTYDRMLDREDKKNKEVLREMEQKHKELLKAKEEVLLQREVSLTEREKDLNAKILRQSSSSLRGQDGENYFATLAQEKMNWTLSDTRHIPHACDYQGTIHHVRSFFEVKHYTHPVPQKEVTKFLRDMKEHPEAKFGAFISLNTPIQGRRQDQPFTVEFVNDSQCVLYVQSCADLDTDHLFSTLDQTIKLTSLFDRKFNTRPEEEESKLKERIELAQPYIQTCIMRSNNLIRRVQTDKKQYMTIIEANTTHNLNELRQQSVELTTCLQKLLDTYVEEPEEEKGEEAPPTALAVKKPKKQAKKKATGPTITISDGIPSE
jgi:hypothetical protein